MEANINHYQRLLSAEDYEHALNATLLTRSYALKGLMPELSIV